jgi:hypothetical protein
MVNGGWFNMAPVARSAGKGVQAEHRQDQRGHDPGDGGGFRWQVRVAPLGSVPFAAQQTAIGHPPQMVLLGVAVAISWSMDGGERQVALDTQRIGFMAPTGP